MAIDKNADGSFLLPSPASARGSSVSNESVRPSRTNTNTNTYARWRRKKKKKYLRIADSMFGMSKQKAAAAASPRENRGRAAASASPAGIREAKVQAGETPRISQEMRPCRSSGEDDGRDGPEEAEDNGRRRNQFSKDERMHLLSVMGQYAPRLDDRSASVFDRREIWRAIERDFHRAGFTGKTSAQLKKYWQNYKYHGRRAQAVNRA